MPSLRPPLALVVVLTLGATGTLAQPHARRLGQLFHRGAAPVGPSRAPRVAGTDTAACPDCHVEIAREWQDSQHARAWRDDVFQAAYAIEPMAFCRNCHAPSMARGARTPDARAAEAGVSCEVCHVRGGRVLGTGNGRGDAPGRSAPHEVLPVRAFSESAYCAGCHQFDFPGDRAPGRPRFATDEPMQDTFAEWSMSSAATRGVQCQGCHMPMRATADGRAYRSHGFPGSGDRTLLERAVRVTVNASREGTAAIVRAQVIADDTGHSFPTGDLFRRAELRVWVGGAEDRAQLHGFAREFADVLERGPAGASVFVRRQQADTRVPPPGLGAARTITFRFDGPAPVGTPLRIWWRLEHLLMPSPLAASQGFGPARNRTTIAEGSVDLAGTLAPSVQRADVSPPPPRVQRLTLATNPGDPR